MVIAMSNGAVGPVGIVMMDRVLIFDVDCVGKSTRRLRMQFKMRNFVLAILVMTFSIIVLPQIAEADDMVSIESVIAYDLENYGWSANNLFYSARISFAANYALATTELGPFGAAGQQFLLASNNGVWSIVGKGGGRMNESLLEQGYHVPSKIAITLLSECVNTGKRFTRTKLLRGQARMVETQVRIHGKFQKVRFDAPKSSTKCVN